MLCQQGLVTAARLATTDADTMSSVVTMAFTQLLHASDSEARLIARALSHLEPHHLPSSMALTVHQQPWIRCLAAHRSDADSADLQLSRHLLAADPDCRVRVNLAQSLPDGHELLTRLRLDPRRQVRHAAMRTTCEARSV